MRIGQYLSRGVCDKDKQARNSRLATSHFCDELLEVIIFMSCRGIRHGRFIALRLPEDSQGEFSGDVQGDVHGHCARQTPAGP
jgi:hypothetical protein